jgi:hypothetical protein
MPKFEVTVDVTRIDTLTEYWVVEADNEADARKNWSGGELVNTKDWGVSETTESEVSEVSEVK